MPNDESRAPALAAMIISMAALVLAALSIPSALGARVPGPPPGPQAGPAVLDFSLLITGVGPPGGVIHHSFNPSMIVVRRGDTVRVRVMNQSFATHGIVFEGFNARTGRLPGGPKGQETISFVANKGGVFPFRCYVPYLPGTGDCTPDHESQVGYLVVVDPSP